MANRSITVNTIKEIIRLNIKEGLTIRKTARALSISRPCIKSYLDKFIASGITLEEFEKKTDKEINNIFFPKKKAIDQKRFQILENEFPEYKKELTKTGVTRELLWQEYRRKEPNGYAYSQFCYYYGKWAGIQESWMHQEYKAGEKLFVDFTGEKLKIKGEKPGLEQTLEVFVAILGCSQLTYVKAVASQKTEDWIDANISALNYFNGVPCAIVPDCLKSGVKTANKYEPEINQQYSDFAQHYNTVILPARPYSPKDKALVEKAVKDIYTRIFARIRNETFYTIDDLNERIMELLEEHNNTKFQMRPESRRDLFETVEKSSLKPLPQEKFELKGYEEHKVGLDYHIKFKVDEHYYSVPYRYIGEKVKLVYTAHIVEIYHNFERIAVHERSRYKYKYSTQKEHMPDHHKFQAKISPEKLISWANNIGENVKTMITAILNDRPYPEQAYKSCLGVITLSKKYGKTGLDQACQRALSFNCFQYKTVKNILEKKLEQNPEEEIEERKLPVHENIRGAEYYN